ncbi:MAG: hypothetical protein ABI430_01870 [Candidatus Taylorbacteria bacterium]
MNFDQPQVEKQIDKEQAIKEFKEIFKSAKDDVDALYILNATGPLYDSGSINSDLVTNGIENTKVMLRRVKEFEVTYGVDLQLKGDIMSLQASLDSRGSFGAGSKSRELVAKIRSMEDGSFLK